jgi:hypothetical protein
MPAVRLRRFAVLLPLAVAATAPSCAYWRARADDLHDSVLYRWHDGALGGALEAKLGPLDAALGAWIADTGWGKDTFWQTPGETLTRQGLGVPFTTLGPLLWRAPAGHFFATSALGNHPADPQSFQDVRAYLGLSDVFDLDGRYPYVLTPQRRIADLFGVEVGAVPVFWGARVGFNVAEFADFLLGFAFVDLMGDDGEKRPPTIPYRPLRGE